MLTRLLSAGVPVEPDADTARRWATEELARGIYAERTGLLERAIAWLLERLDDLARMTSGDTGWVLPTAVVVVTAVAVVLGMVVGRPARHRRALAEHGGVLEGEVRTAAALRGAADAAAARGDHAAAVLERFRAMVRSLADRAVLAERPGMTAHEAVAEAAARFPRHEPDLARAGHLFDAVRYGHAGATAEDDAWLRRVDAEIAADRPAALVRASRESIP